VARTVYGQNGDTETATEMAIFKTATNPNNTYSSSEAYIIDLMAWHATVKLHEKSTIFHRAQCLTLARNRSEPVIFFHLMTALQKLHSLIN